MYIDLTIAVFLALGMFKGFKRGLIIELCTLMALVLGVFGAYYFGSETADILTKEFNTDKRVSIVLAFAILFIGIVVGVYFFGKTLEKLIKIIALGLLNKLAGLVFGGLKFAIILSALIFILSGFPLTKNLIPKNQIEESYLYEPIESISYVIYPKLEKYNLLDKLEEGFDSLKEEISE